MDLIAGESKTITTEGTAVGRTCELIKTLLVLEHLSICIEQYLTYHSIASGAFLSNIYSAEFYRIFTECRKRTRTSNESRLQQINLFAFRLSIDSF